MHWGEAWAAEGADWAKGGSPGWGADWGSADWGKGGAPGWGGHWEGWDSQGWAGHCAGAELGPGGGPRGVRTEASRSIRSHANRRAAYYILKY